MTKNLPKIFLVAILLCIAVYIGVFIGRTSSKDIIHILNMEAYQQNSYNDNSSFRKIDLNEATAKDLTDIPGVDLSVAKAIVEYRDKYGRYYKVRELLDVNGVTDELYNTIKEYVTVNN